jgi:long-chain acyl-CoA synthetase
MYKELDEFKTLIQYVDYWARKRGNSVALEDPITTLTYLEVKKKIIGAQQYSEKIGLQTGDTIAVSAPRSVELVILYLTFWGLGINVVPLPEDLKNNKKTKEICDLTEVDYVLEYSHSLDRWMLYSTYDFLGNSNQPQYTIFEYVSFIKEVTKLNECSLIDIASPTYFNLTSGSTGNVKAVKVGDEELIFNALQLNKRFPMDSDDCHCCLFSTDMHPHELFVRPIITGSKSLMLPSNQLRHFKEYLTGTGITHLLATPHTIKHLIQFSREKDDWENIKYILTGGENVSLSLREMFYEITDKKLLIAWGSTETNGIAITVPESLSLDGEDILGLPVPGYEVRIDPVNSELLVKGKSCVNKYWKSNSSFLTKDGYYRTGDLAGIDTEGVIRYKGRVNSIIKAGGRKISLHYLETQIERLKEIQDTAVVYDQEESSILIYISFQSDIHDKEASLRKLRKIVSDELEAARFRIILESEIPKLPNGKKDRRTLVIHKERQHN